MTIKPEDLDKEQRARLVRMFEEYEPGERVRAVCAIVDAASATEIAEGSVGVVRETGALGCSPLFRVQWAIAGDEPAASFEIVTSAENLEPVDRLLRGSFMVFPPGSDEHRRSLEAVLEHGLPFHPARVAESLARTHDIRWKDRQRPHLAIVAPPAAEPGPGAAGDVGAFAARCQRELPDIRRELVELERAWGECVNDLEAVGVLRNGHVPPDGIAKVHIRMHGLRACIRVLDVLVAEKGAAP